MRQRALDDRLCRLEAEVELRLWRAAILAALPERHRAAVAKALASVAPDSDHSAMLDALIDAMLAAVPPSFFDALRALVRGYEDKPDTSQQHSPAEQRESLVAALRAAGERELDATSHEAGHGGADHARWQAWCDGQLARLECDPVSFWSRAR